MNFQVGEWYIFFTSLSESEIPYLKTNFKSQKILELGYLNNHEIVLKWIFLARLFLIPRICVQAIYGFVYYDFFSGYPSKFNFHFSFFLGFKSLDWLKGNWPFPTNTVVRFLVFFMGRMMSSVVVMWISLVLWVQNN